MPDSTSAGQDDGAQVVDKGRFDGLMAAHQKVLAELRELKGSQGQTAEADSTGPALAEGQMFEVAGGQLVPVDRPVPRGNNGAREIGGRKALEDMASSELVRQLDKIEGRETRPSGGWFGR